jgi:hypothetical protein
MFSKIPQKFTAPFALLGDEAKLAFRSQPNGILKLSATRVCTGSDVLLPELAHLSTPQNIPEADNYWNQVRLLHRIYIIRL